MVNSSKTTTGLPEKIEGINVLALVGSDVGDNFLDVRDTLEDWNCTVTTIAQLGSSVLTHGGTAVSVDIHLADFDLDTDLDEYDALFVPSGAWWLGVSVNTVLTDFIKDVYDRGLIVGSMCVGCGILGAAGIVEGKKLLCHINSAYLITDAGGTRIGTYNVVTDERIVTGDTGTGISGHENAPYVEFSQMLVKEILGLSYLDQYTIEEIDDVSHPERTHIISVTTQILPELDSILSGNERNISEVTVSFYPNNDRKSIIEVELVEIAENSFEGYIGEEVDGKYTVKIEICNHLNELEIVTVDASIWINSIPGYSILTLFSTGIAVIGIILLITRKSINKK